MAPHVFISYAEADRPVMVAFRDRLESAGVDCWEARRDIPPGADYATAIMEAIEHSRAMLVLVSGASDASPHVVRELEHAVQMGVPLLPVRLGTSPLSRRLRYFLGPAQFATVSGAPGPDDVDAILRTLQPPRAPPESGGRSAHEETGSVGVAGSPKTGARASGGAPDELEVVSPSELYARGVSTQALIDELIQIDYETLDGASGADVGQTATWAPVVEVNPDGMRLVVDRGLRVLAYWHFLPLDDETFARAKAGTLDDGEIRVEHLNVIGLPGDYNLHFMIVCIRRGHRGVVMMRRLLDAFSDVLLQLSRRDVYFAEMCATAFTPEGEALCRTVRMRAIGRHVHRGTIYHLSLSDLPPSIFYVPELRDRYAAHFREGASS